MNRLFPLYDMPGLSRPRIDRKRGKNTNLSIFIDVALNYRRYILKIAPLVHYLHQATEVIAAHSVFFFFGFSLFKA